MTPPISATRLYQVELYSQHGTDARHWKVVAEAISERYAIDYALQWTTTLPARVYYVAPDGRQCIFTTFVESSKAVGYVAA